MSIKTFTYVRLYAITLPFYDRTASGPSDQFQMLKFLVTLLNDKVSILWPPRTGIATLSLLRHNDDLWLTSISFDRTL